MGTNKKATGPCIKNNAEVNQSCAKMNKYLTLVGQGQGHQMYKFQCKNGIFTCFGNILHKSS